MDSLAVFNGSQLAPTLIKLGEAIGILMAVPDTENAYQLNQAWFQNPLNVTGDNLGTNGATIASLFTELLGEVSAGALGLPGQDLGAMGRWNPIPNPQTGKATGFYLVNYPQDPNLPNGDQIFGIGVLQQWKFDAVAGADGVNIGVRAWGLLPILKIGTGGMSLVLGQSANPLNMGLEFSGADQQNIVDANGLSFNGVKVSAQLQLAPSPQVDLSVVILKLKLPTELVATDRNLAQVAQITPQAWLSTVATMFVTALQKVLQQDTQLANLLPIFGLSPIVPGSEVRLPMLAWDQLLSLASSGQAIYTPFVAWFNQLLAQENAFTTWMQCIASLLGLPSAKASGSGSQADPYLVSLLNDDGVGKLSLSMVTRVDAAGTRYLLPGLNFVSKAQQLGTAPAQITLRAQFDLAQFSLATTGSVGINTSFLNLNAGFALTNTDPAKPLFEGKIEEVGYVFGNLTAGIALLQGETGGLSVVPAFQLNNVVTPTGKFDSIDLTQPAKLVDQLIEDLYKLVDAGMAAVFGLNDNSSYGYQAAVMLGVIAPKLAEGQTWPAELAPPFTAAQLVNSFKNPVAALANYYINLVSNQVQIGGQIPLFYVVSALGKILNSVSGLSQTVQGKGSRAEPWLIPVTDQTFAASLLAYVDNLAEAGSRLTFGLQIAPNISFGSGNTLQTSINVQALSLQLPAKLDGGALVATIFPGMAVQLTLPQGIETPSVAGASVKVDKSVFTGTWSPYGSWHWNMEVGQPAVIVDGNTLPVGQNMVFSDQDSMQELVDKQAQTFAPIVVALMGVAVYRTSNRPGLALNGILGLLPNLAAFVPQGLTWPANMPSLQVHGFSDPVGDIQRQIAALLANSDYSRAALSLLGWAVSNTAAVPSVSGEGSFDQPFAVPFALPGDFEIAVWTQGEGANKGQILGSGLRRQFDFSYGSGASAIHSETEVLLRLVEVGLTAPVQENAFVPGLRLQSKITPSTPITLVGTAGGSLQWMSFGLQLGVANGSLVLQPLMSLRVVNEQGVGVDYLLQDLAGASSQWLAAFYGAVNVGIGSLITPLLSNSAIKNAYEVLQLMDLVLPLAEGSSAAINTAGWTAMLAAPLEYFKQRGIALFTDNASRALAIQVLQDITGITLPPVPLALLQLAHGMQLLENQADGFAPRIYDWTQVMAQPAQQLKQRFMTLVQDPVLLAQLIAEMTDQVQSIEYGPLKLTVSQGAVFQLTLGENAQVMLGNLLQITGGLKFDLLTQQLVGELGLFCAAVQLDLRSQLALNLRRDINLDFKVDLAWGDGSQPMPMPLQLYPFKSEIFLPQVQVLAPNFALATFFGQVVNARLLNNYQIARTALTALGLVLEDGGKWYMKSPLGLFDQPLQWLLGDAVLGQNGQLNIATLNKVFATITSKSTASNGVGVEPISNGIRIFGLPYSQQIELVADVSKQLFQITPSLPKDKQLALVDGVSLQEFSFTLALGPNFQPGFAGNIAVSGDISANNTLLVKGGYDSGFLLSAGLLQNKQTFQVLPFPGWQTLAIEALTQAAQFLLRNFSGKLLDELAKLGAQEFVGNLRNAAQLLKVMELVDELAAVTDLNLDEMGRVALNWLTGRFATANVNDSIGAVVTLLKPYFPQIKQDNSLLSYKPSQSLPVTLLTGVQTLDASNQLGIWVALELPASKSIVLALDATGIGIPLQADGKPVAGFKPQLHFQFSVLAPIQDKTGPKLEMRFDMQQTKFVLGIDPAGKADSNSTYYRELLPVFFGEPDQSKWGAAVLSWLEDLLLNIVPRYVSIVVLNQKTVKAWMDTPLFKDAGGASANGPSAASLLRAAQLLIVSEAEKPEDRLYMLNSLTALQALTIESFLAGFLRALLEKKFQLIKIGSAGGIWIGPREAGSDLFGVRVMLPNISLAAVPYVTFQLGEESTEWIVKAGGDGALEGGISLYVPISTTAPDFSKTVLELVNIGLDFVGKQNQNLVQLDRFVMRAIQPRGLITFDFGKSNVVSGYGGGVTLSDIGISLAPNIATPGKDVNPVAQNLLGSGNASSSQKENPVANPTFSVRTSYVSKLYVELFSGQETSVTNMWFPVQRSFGPLYANKVGIGWQQNDYLLNLLFDGNVTMAGLFVCLQELSVGVPVKTPLDFGKYKLDLAGIDISFKGGAVEIQGAFLKQDNPLSYTGLATVKAAKFGLSAMGSYAVIPVDPNMPDGETAASLFIFANLNLPLGPDPAFFINGLAAGFGYNRNILIPEPGEIASFPLVQGAIDSSVFGGGSATPESALEVLNKVVKPEIGQYWAAGGIQFSTYQLLNSFALLIVRFGNEFAIDLVGLSTASFPPKVKPNMALAYVELGLLVSFRPSQGMVSVRAQLTPNSFVLSQDCRLTGGFAAVLWYAGEHAGNFVLTLGGYNPAFKVPDFYPVVPQLGFNWPMDLGFGSLSIKGGSYFALTPSAIMAGGYLEVLFKTGPLRAWFNAGVDFLIQWQPFYFRLNGYVSVGAGIEVTIAGVKVNLSAQIGARLVMWGPPIAGEVNVDWYVISFSIPFGDTKQSKPKVQPLAWDAFQQSFLPPLSIQEGDTAVRSMSAAKLAKVHPTLLRAQEFSLPEPGLTQAYAVLKAQVELGLLNDYESNGWVIAAPFTLNLNTVIPSTSLSFVGAANSFTGPAIGIQPMQQSSVQTPLAITLYAWDASQQQWQPTNLDQRKLIVGSLNNGVPDALWSKAAFEPDGVPQAKVIENGIVGASLSGISALLNFPVGPMELAVLGIVQLGPLPLPFNWTPVYPQQPVGSQNNRAQIIADTIMAPAIVVVRDAIYSALRQVGQPAMDSPNLVVLQHNVGNIFQSPPSLASIAANLLPAPLASSRTVQQGMQSKALAAAVPSSETHLIGSSVSYRSNPRTNASANSGPQALSRSASNGLNVSRLRSRSKWLPASNSGAQANTRALGATGGLGLQMAAGHTSIVRLGQQAKRQVRASGTLPVRLCSFNQYHEPLQQSLLNPALQAQYDLPADAETVVAIANPADDHQVIGWYHDSEWTRLNRYYYHAGNCLVRPQSIPNLGQAKHGNILASSVLAGNQVQKANGSLANGWLETVFLDTIQSLAVVVQGSQAPRVQLSWSKDLAQPNYDADASPSRVQVDGDTQIYWFDIPARSDDAAQLAVLVHAACHPSKAKLGTCLQGVLGFVDAPQALLQRGGSAQLVCHAGCVSTTQPSFTQLQIS